MAKITGVYVSPTKVEIRTVEDNLETYYDMLECDTIDVAFRKLALTGAYYDFVVDENGLFNPDAEVVAINPDREFEVLVGSKFVCKTNSRGEFQSLDKKEIADVLANIRIYPTKTGEVRYCVVLG